MTLPDNKLLAAVDIGSNSVHLILARVVHGALQPVQRYKERVQLAAGLDSSRQLDDAAIARGVQCLQRMGKIIRDNQPDVIRAVATFTIREARNREVFLQQAEQALGCPIEVISGREEARLIFLGVAHDETLSEPTLVIDIGGGSTELAIGQGFEPEFRESCRMGCVSFSQQFFTETIDARSFASAQTAALQAMEKHLPRLARCDWQRVYATSGSARALQQYCVALGEDGASIGLQHLLQIRELLLAAGHCEVLLDYGISEDRIQLVPGGLAILLTIVQRFGIEQLRYRDVALREGVLYELDEQMRHPDIRVRTRNSLLARYQIDAAYGELVAKTCHWLLEQVRPGWPGLGKLAGDLLCEAAHLHEIGRQVSASGVQKHSAYILSNSDLPGYNRDQQQLLGALVSQHRKRLRPELLPESRELAADDLLRLLRLLRLAVVLTITRQPAALDKLRCEVASETLKLAFESGYLQENPLLEADLMREQQYSSSIGINLLFN